MGTQPGFLCSVYRNAGSGWNEQFVFNALSLPLNTTAIDVSTFKHVSNSLGHRMFVPGMRDSIVTGSGFAHAAHDANNANGTRWLTKTFTAGSDHNLRFIWPQYGRLQSYFIVSAFEVTATMDEGIAFSATFHPSAVTNQTVPVWLDENASGGFT